MQKKNLYFSFIKMDLTGKTVTAMRIVANVLDTEQGHAAIGKEALTAKKI